MSRKQQFLKIEKTGTSDMETIDHDGSTLEEWLTISHTQLRTLKAPQLRKALNMCVPEINKLRHVNSSNRRLIANLRKKIFELSDNALLASQDWLTTGIQEPANMLGSCRFCLSEERMENLQIIDGTDTEFHDLPAIYEEVTASQLQISNEYSSFGCDICINLLRRSAAVIRNFREVDEFWKKYLLANCKSECEGEMKTEYVAEIKMEFVNVNGDGGGDDDGAVIDEPVFFQFSEDTANQLKYDEDFIKSEDVEHIETSSVSNMDDELTRDIEEIDVDNLIADVQEETVPDNIGPSKWTCTVCHKKFSSKGRWQNHQNKAHTSSEKLYNCTICNENISGRSALYQHKQMHKPPAGNFKCDQCNQGFQLRAHLKNHMWVHARSIDDLTSCELCNKTFANVHRLKRHMGRVHGTVTKSQCNTCGKVFKNEERLKHHAFRHTEKKLQCDICKRLFLLKKNLKAHMSNKHSSYRPFICDTCGVAFKSTDALNRHKSKPECDSKRLTRNEPAEILSNGMIVGKFTCELCPARQYGILKTMAAHYAAMHPHENWSFVESTYCKVCSRKFTTPEQVEDHRLATHGHLQCPICKRYMVCDATLRSHMKTHSDKERPFTCEICGSAHLSLPRLQTHKRRHYERSFQCSECYSSFFEKFELAAHTRTVHAKQRRFSCHCGMQFNSRTAYSLHMTIHTKDFKWTCDECPMKFFNSQVLKRHTMISHPKKLC